MSSFSNSNIRVLSLGAVVLGAGIYYEGVAAQRVDEASQALRSVEGAQSQVEIATQRARKYVDLLEDMADENVDRHEPFAVDSEFSPQEIKQIAALLEKLYQRDGHFFLQRFELAWRNGNQQRGLLPRVALDLEGRKVLLFSNDAGETPALAAVN